MRPSTVRKPITKCSFCKYYSGSSCMVKESAYYCREALQEYYAWLKKQNKKPYNKNR